ncbi:MAG TPA: universal stress protein [Candidatus Accumulibacter phosphatis]|nr:MAG: Stress response protein NhaX [Candidatus Accumulibacter sp. SK-11]HAY27023.1 universal stress protein [Accumulibacter sp.]HRL75810.1 universal stress protein [Candidatus Accumulibacter phosphatis]HCN66816.1 universal stress protein [Accumulibacter sp.]HCV12728.1 universal stress protein [Accumulibacter sp.]
MTTRWLLPVDGSLPALRAVDHVIGEARSSPIGLDILLLNVQHPLPSDISRFVSPAVVHDYHRETGDTALAAARARLEAAGIGHAVHVLTGEVAPTIVDFAHEHDCGLIVMGARGLGTVAGLLLGSVTQRVIHLTDLPVVVVK